MTQRGTYNNCNNTAGEIGMVLDEIIEKRNRNAVQITVLAKLLDAMHKGYYTFGAINTWQWDAKIDVLKALRSTTDDQLALIALSIRNYLNNVPGSPVPFYGSKQGGACDYITAVLQAKG